MGGGKVVDIDVYYTTDGDNFKQIEPIIDGVTKKYIVYDQDVDESLVILITPQGGQTYDFYYSMTTYGFVVGSINYNLRCLRYELQMAGVNKSVLVELESLEATYRIDIESSIK